METEAGDFDGKSGHLWPLWRNKSVCFYQELRIISRHVCGDKKLIFLTGSQYVGSCVCGNETGCF